MRMLPTRFGFPHHLLRDNEGLSFSHVCVNRFILTSLLRVRSRPSRGSVCFRLLFTSAPRMTTGAGVTGFSLPTVGRTEFFPGLDRTGTARMRTKFFRHGMPPEIVTG